MTGPFWLTAFLDLPADRYDAGLAFWEGVTGYQRSAPRGEHDEFVSLLPTDGDDFLRVQRLADGPARIHLDVHVAELPDSGEDRGGYVTTTSPGGLVFCYVRHPAATRPAPRDWGGHASLVDQVCLDIPPTAYDDECAFWQRLTGYELVHRDGSEFSSLVRPPRIPLRLLLQRLDQGDGPVSAHLDLATSDRARETTRQLELGARLEQVNEHWTVLVDPAGLRYCLTDRDPETGMLG